MIHEHGCLNITESEWRPRFMQTDRQTNGGDSQVITTGIPYWIADVRIDTVSREAFNQWDAWVNSRQAAKVPFLMSRTFNMFPQDQTPSSDAGLSVSGVNAAASTVSLAGAGTYQARPGDMLSYYTSYGGYWIGQVTDTVDAAGGALTIPVTPYPFPPHPTLAKPRRIMALGEFYISDSPGRTGNPDLNFIEFEARQFVRGANAAASAISVPDQRISRALDAENWTP